MNLHPAIIAGNILLAVIDIVIITYIFFKFYQILAQTRAVQVVRGLLFFLVLYVLSKILQLETFSWLLDQIAGVAVIAIIILFQPELRRVLTKLGQSNWVSKIIKKNPEDLVEIIKAVNNFHLISRGALIVFEREIGLKNYIESGTKIDSKISTQLLMTIFFDKTPLHDGAVIIKNNLIVAAGCYLPLSDSSDIDPKFGTRHRAALGLAEETDAVVVVVSEETGKITIASDGKLYTNYTIDLLKKELVKLLGYNEDDLENTEDEI
ncbi:MAG: TIGR00159 family protein [Spirochaetes bacterium GWF1_31_7]|nr:MAG: TIGR00159 family protein [Spirochaetes bacterium GWE1_32_154]OHD48395.1 MAG: TIGR00159 family protein [Spirochaetes bacterium GWF1_31_7]OHD50489.1 MAG: TIGR00159 family protein [Spirochaetes bacterium GWE2_31_10]OHD81601.1 MAG: TIGR00159 family protein [Spirochaetes bacterium RIFOXYB1_FULL_32_8]